MLKYIFIFTFIFPVLLLVSHSFLGSLSFFSNTPFRTFFQKIFGDKLSYVQNIPFFLLYNYLDLLHIISTPLDLFATLRLISNSYSSWYTNCFPQECSEADPSPARIISTVTGVFYPAVTTGWSETHQGQCEEHSRCHIILSQPTPIHGPCTLLLQASIHLSYPQDSTTFLLHLLKVVLCVFLSEINSHLSESVASPGLNFEVRSSIQHYFIILSDIRLYVGFVCPWNICSHTSLPLSLELPKNRGHV